MKTLTIAAALAAIGFGVSAAQTPLPGQDPRALAMYPIEIITPPHVGLTESVSTKIKNRASPNRDLIGELRGHPSADAGSIYDLRRSFTLTGDLHFAGKVTPIRMGTRGQWYALIPDGALLLKVEKRGEAYVAIVVVNDNGVIKESEPTTLQLGTENRVQAFGFRFVFTPAVATKSLDTAAAEEIRRRQAIAQAEYLRSKGLTECDTATCLPEGFDFGAMQDQVWAELEPMFAAR